MNVNSTIPIGLVGNRPGDQPLQLRVNQRVTAEILGVSGDQVNLAIQGVKVVGRLVGSDNAASLAEQRFTQFIVRGMKDGVLQLQLALVKGTQDTTPQTTQWSILTKNLLRLNGLPVNESNVILGKALLGQGLPLTSNLMSELSSVLQELGSWGQPEAELAAALKSNNLPLTKNALILALKNFPSLGNTAFELTNELSRWLASNPRSDLKGGISKTIALLQHSFIQWDSNASSMAEQLSNVIRLLGTSFEAELANQLNKQSSLEDTNGLLLLNQLKNALSIKGESGLANKLDQFLNGIRQLQYLNSGKIGDPTNPPWLSVTIPLSSKENIYDANLKVAYRSGEGERKIDPHNTRMVFSIDLEDGEYLEVDLSMVNKRIGAWLTVPDSEWNQLVEDEMSDFKERLEKIGFELQFARCEVQQKSETINLRTNATYWPAEKINLEI